MAEILSEHYTYLADTVRVERYEAAIANIVQPGYRVLDLGCGAGILGLMALRAGAGEVFFVDQTAVIDLARQTISQAGFLDQARFFRTSSFELELPERVDLIICDHVGCFGFDYDILRVLGDARRRFLKPDGVIMPTDVVISLAPIASQMCRHYVDRWRDDRMPEDFHWISSTSAHKKYLLDLTPDELLADPATLATLDLEAEPEAFYTWQGGFTCAQDGSLDGVAGWFDSGLAGGVRMTNSPLADDRVDRPQAFLPLEEPVAVQKGERIEATIMARPLDHVIAWTVELPDSNRRLSLTTFNGLLLDRDTIAHTQQDRKAVLNQRGRARQVIASYCDGSRSIAEVQQLVLAKHGDLLPSEQALMSLVREVLSKDTTI